MKKENIKSIFAVALTVTSVIVMAAMTFSSQQFLFAWIVWVVLFACGINMLD